MTEINAQQHNDFGIQELTPGEIECISGGAGVTGQAAFGAAAAIGAATFGSAWGGVAVGVAFAAAPVAVIAMGGLCLYGAYKIMSH
jgi:hypothetical protein